MTDCRRDRPGGVNRSRSDAQPDALPEVQPDPQPAVPQPEIATTGAAPPRLLDRLREAIRVRHYSIRTEDAYADWARRFIVFHGKRHPLDLGAAEVAAFLTHLAVQRNVAASTQNQAKSALLFLYRVVLGVELPWLDEVIGAKSPRRLPVVLTPAQVRALLHELNGTMGLVASLLYGTGMRLLEGLRLRVKDIDFERREIVSRRQGRQGPGDGAAREPDAAAERAPFAAQGAARQGPGRRPGRGLVARCAGGEVPACRAGLGLAVGVSLAARPAPTRAPA